MSCFNCNVLLNSKSDGLHCEVAARVVNAYLGVTSFIWHVGILVKHGINLRIPLFNTAARSDLLITGFANVLLKFKHFFPDNHYVLVFHNWLVALIRKDCLNMILDLGFGFVMMLVFIYNN